MIFMERRKPKLISSVSVTKTVLMVINNDLKHNILDTGSTELTQIWFIKHKISSKCQEKPNNTEIYQGC